MSAVASLLGRLSQKSEGGRAVSGTGLRAAAAGGGQGVGGCECVSMDGNGGRA